MLALRGWLLHKGVHPGPSSWSTPLIWVRCAKCTHAHLEEASKGISLMLFQGPPFKQVYKPTARTMCQYPSNSCVAQNHDIHLPSFTLLPLLLKNLHWLAACHTCFKWEAEPKQDEPSSPRSCAMSSYSMGYMSSHLPPL